MAVAAASASPQPALISTLQQVVAQLQTLVQALASMPSLQAGTAATAGAAVGANATGGGSSGLPSTGGAAGCGCGDAVSGAQVAQSASPGALGAPTAGLADVTGKDAKDAKGGKDSGGAKQPKGAAGTAPASSAAATSGTPVGPSNFDNLQRKNPRTVAQMVDWVKHEVANPSKDWYRLCGNFSASAFGWKSSGQATAAAQWANTPASMKHTSGEPQPGALLFYSTGNPAGHVAVYLGNGQVASTDIKRKGKVDIVPLGYIEQHWGSKYLGWTPPYFPKAGG